MIDVKPQKMDSWASTMTSNGQPPLVEMGLYLYSITDVMDSNSLKSHQLKTVEIAGLFR